MEAGFSYGPFGAEASVSTTVAAGLATDVETTYGVDYGIENTTTCSATEKAGAGLYQWVVVGDDNITAFTWHTVCRTGEDWATPPACPWNACEDAECYICADWMAPS